MYNAQNTKFSCDWLNVRLSVDDLNDFLEKVCHVLKIDLYEDLKEREKGVCFYPKGYYIPEVGYSSIVFCYNPDGNGGIKNTPPIAFEKSYVYGVLCSISGDGCRWLQSKGVFRDFVDFLWNFDPHCTRIDMACDFLDKNNGVVPLVQAFAESAYSDKPEYYLTCNLQKKPGYVRLNDNYDPDVKGFTRNVTVGGRNSEKGAMQLYNKKVEYLDGRLSEIALKTFAEYGVTDYWWRLEYRMKSDAQNTFIALSRGSALDAFLYAANSFGTFLFATDEATNRCDVEFSWAEFIQYMEEFEHVIDFVELATVPYIAPDVDRRKKWTDYNCKVIYQSILCMLNDPDLCKAVVSKGFEKTRSDPKCRSFCRSYEQKYGHSPSEVDYRIMINNLGKLLYEEVN